jgi:hypothetical protein
MTSTNRRGQATMSRVMDAWNAVLREAVSQDYDEQQFALFQIGLILQRHNPHVQPESDVHQETLSRELLRLTLNHDRQRAAVEYLADSVARYPENADSFLFAMGNAQPMILVEPLLDVIQQHGGTWDANTAYQALLALHGCLRHGDETVKQAIQDAPLDPLLTKWADSSDELLSEKAQVVQRRIQNL